MLHTAELCCTRHSCATRRFPLCSCGGQLCCCAAVLLSLSLSLALCAYCCADIDAAAYTSPSDATTGAAPSPMSVVAAMFCGVRRRRPSPAWLLGLLLGCFGFLLGWQGWGGASLALAACSGAITIPCRKPFSGHHSHSVHRGRDRIQSIAMGAAASPTGSAGPADADAAAAAAAAAGGARRLGAGRGVITVASVAAGESGSRTHRTPYPAATRRSAAAASQRVGSSSPNVPALRLHADLHVGHIGDGRVLKKLLLQRTCMRTAHASLAQDSPWVLRRSTPIGRALARHSTRPHEGAADGRRPPPRATRRPRGLCRCCTAPDRPGRRTRFPGRCAARPACASRDGSCCPHCRARVARSPATPHRAHVWGRGGVRPSLGQHPALLGPPPTRAPASRFRRARPVARLLHAG